MLCGVHGMKILAWDVETSPIVGAVWGLWEQNLSHHHILEDWNLLTVAWKWIGKSKVEAAAVSPKSPTNDKELVKRVHAVLSEADVLVAHNGDKFDLKKFNARAIFNGLAPLPPITTIDTLKVAKSVFAFTSNRLDYLGHFLGVGRKMETGGLNLWLKVMKGDKDALAKMVKYNKVDVEVLEGVYQKLRPYMRNHPNEGLTSKVECCPTCGSEKFAKSGVRHTRTRSYQRYQCGSCQSWFSGEPVGAVKLK
jgi:ribosomal protein S27AE